MLFLCCLFLYCAQNSDFKLKAMGTVCATQICRYCFVYILSLIYITFGVTIYCWSAYCICLGEIWHLQQILQKSIFVDDSNIYKVLIVLSFLIKCLLTFHLFCETNKSRLHSRKYFLLMGKTNLALQKLFYRRDVYYQRERCKWKLIKLSNFVRQPQQGWIWPNW